MTYEEEKKLWLKYNHIQPCKVKYKNELLQQLDDLQLMDDMSSHAINNVLVLLHASYECNANCPYCENQFIRYEYKDQVITKELLDQILTKFGSHIREITWHGGEPLLLPEDLLIYLSEQKQKYNLNFPITLQTNGILLEDKLPLLKKYHIQYGLSYNGIYNTETRGLQSTLAMESILKNSHRGFICVYDELHLEDLIENYEYLKTLNITNFQGNFIRDIKLLDSNLNNMLINNNNDNLELIKEYFRYWIYDTNNPIDDSGITDRIKCLLGGSGNCENSYCIGKWIVVLPNGDISHCGYNNNKTNIFCNINDINSFEELISLPSYQNYIKQADDLIINHCKCCEYYDICYGGCMKEHFSKDGLIFNEAHCALIKNLYDILYDLIKNINLKYDNINPILKQILIDYNFFSLREIKRIEGDKINNA